MKKDHKCSICNPICSRKDSLLLQLQIESVLLRKYSFFEQTILEKQKLNCEISDVNFTQKTQSELLLVNKCRGEKIFVKKMNE